MEIRGQPFLLPCLGWVSLVALYVCDRLADQRAPCLCLLSLFRDAGITGMFTTVSSLSVGSGVWAQAVGLVQWVPSTELPKHLTLLEWFFSFVCFCFFLIIERDAFPLITPDFLSHLSRNYIRRKEGFEDSDCNLGRKTRNFYCDSHLSVPPGLLDKD